MYLEILGDGVVVVSDVVEELQSSMVKYPLFNSAHEGYGVILEELDELWDEVKKRQPDMKNMRAEAVQVAAMAIKFIVSMDNDWKSSQKVSTKSRDFTEEERVNEAKCKQCLYAVLTDEELRKLESDPCEMCYDLCNWQPKELNLDETPKIQG